MYNCFFKRFIVISILLLLFVAITTCSFALLNSFSSCPTFNSKRAMLKNQSYIIFIGKTILT